MALPIMQKKAMRTALDCLPCFLRQTLHASRLCSTDPDFHKNNMDGVLSIIASMDLSQTPPENSVQIYSMIAERSGQADPFAGVKAESNDLIKNLLPRLRKLISNAADPFSTAVKLAIAGNVIDYGAPQVFSVEKAIEECLIQDPWPQGFSQFREDVASASTILYLGDNCGEQIFDMLFIELLADMGKKVTFAVKEKPIINDVLRDDALSCGLDQYCDVISNGTNCPGTPIQSCSEFFREVFQRSDLIISKGQGNYETLSENQGPIYFLLTIKCEVVAHHIAEQADRWKKMKVRPDIGKMILMKNYR